MPASPAQRKASQIQPPSNEQLKEAATKGEKILQQTESEVGPEGQKVLKDTEQILETSKEFLDKKNKDEKLQEMTKTAAQAQEKVSLDELGISQQEKDWLEGVRRDVFFLLRMMAASPKSRTFLFQLVDIVMDVSQKEWKKSAPEKPEEKSPSQLKEEAKEEVQKKDLETIKQDIPQEKVEQAKQKLSDLILDISKNPVLKDFMNTLERLAQSFIKRGEQMKEKHEGKGLGTELDKIQSQLYDFVSRWTSKENLNTFIGNLKEQYQQAKQDPGFKRLYEDWRNFLQQASNQPEKVDQNKEKIEQLIHQTQLQMQEKKNAEVVQKTYESWQVILLDIEQDPLRKKMEEDVQQLAQDLVLDEQGNFSINQKAMEQLRNVLVPSIIEQLEYIPLPPMELQDKNQYALVEDIVVRTKDLVPEKIHLHVSTDVDVKPTELSLAQSQTLLNVSTKDIEVHIHNCKVHFKRSSFPQLQDDLVANLDIYGKQNSLNIQLIAEARTDKETGLYYIHFEPKNVDVVLDSVNLKFVEGKHDTLMNFLTTFMYPRLKSNIRSAVHDNIQSQLKWSCDNVNQSFKLLLKQRAQTQTQ